jgi:predicted phosphoribosyltransferase
MRYRDRTHAGMALAGMLGALSLGKATVLAVPNGGVPVAIQIAEALGIPLGVEIVRKLQIPGNAEAGFGAVSSSGHVMLNQPLVDHLGLGKKVIEGIVAATLDEIHRRAKVFGAPAPPVKGRTAILVDDGLASGFTMAAAASSVSKRGPKKIIVAAPTAPLSSVMWLRDRDDIDDIVCPDIRDVHPFAVAEAYDDWYDLSTEEAANELKRFISEINRNK